MRASPCKTDWTSQGIVLAPEVSYIWGQNPFLYAIHNLQAQLNYNSAIDLRPSHPCIESIV